MGSKNTCDDVTLHYVHTNIGTDKPDHLAHVYMCSGIHDLPDVLQSRATIQSFIKLYETSCSELEIATMWSEDTV